MKCYQLLFTSRLQFSSLGAHTFYTNDCPNVLLQSPVITQISYNVREELLEIWKNTSRLKLELDNLIKQNFEHEVYLKVLKIPDVQKKSHKVSSHLS